MGIAINCAGRRTVKEDSGRERAHCYMVSSNRGSITRAMQYRSKSLLFRKVQSFLETAEHLQPQQERDCHP